MRSSSKGITSGLLVACSLLTLSNGGCGIFLLLWPTSQDKTVLEQADERAKLLDADAVIFQASGVNGASFDGSGSETLSWAFYATDPAAATTVWEITYDGENWDSEVSNLMPVGVAFYDLLNVTLTEARARQLLANAGYEDDFWGWTLSKPVTATGSDPLYYFVYSDMTVTVNATTEAVSGVNLEVPMMSTNGGGAPGDDSVSVQMIANAEAYVKANVDSNAFVIWTGGREGSGESLTQAGDTNVWDFYAVLNSDTEVRAWQLTYDGTWTSAELEMPPFGIEFTSLSYLTMDVVEAWTLATDAGYDPPFAWWSVFKPLYPGVENANYVFPYGGGYVLVDVVTGDVRFE